MEMETKTDMKDVFYSFLQKVVEVSVKAQPAFNVLNRGIGVKE